VLPHQGWVSYDLGVDADLKKVSSNLPSPLGNPVGESLSLRLKVSGGLNGFTLTGSTGKQSNSNNEWLFAKKQVTLARAAWQNVSGGGTPLLTIKSLTINLSTIDGGQWLVLSAPVLKHGGGFGGLSFPNTVAIKTPHLLLAARFSTS
jgi:uncharacterized protein YhdP